MLLGVTVCTHAATVTGQVVDSICQGEGAHEALCGGQWCHLRRLPYPCFYSTLRISLPSSASAPAGWRREHTQTRISQ